MKSKSVKFYGYVGILIGCFLVLYTLVAYSLPTKQIGKWSFWESVWGVLHLTGGVLFIVGGTGLVKKKNWGRILIVVLCLLLSLGIAVLLIVMTVVLLRYGGSIINIGTGFCVLILALLILMIRDISAHSIEKEAQK